MSQDTCVTAILFPAPDKLDRLKDVFEDWLISMRENEPGTLEFSIHEAETEEGVQWFLYERYASHSAVEKHKASEGRKRFFRKVQEDVLFVKPPIVLSGMFWKGFRR